MEALSDSIQTFNTPLEAGLRALFVLVASGRRALDLQRLIYFDYAMIHTAEFGGPTSLHPSTPSRGAQLLVRRALLQDGLELMRSRDLINRRYAASGIGFQATGVGSHLTEQFASRYSELLRERASWVVMEMNDRSDSQLRTLFASQTQVLDDEIVSLESAGQIAADRRA